MPVTDAAFGLSPDIIEQIRAALINHPEIEQAIIYGSRAKGNYKPGSDIDLTLKGPQLTLPILLQLETELDDILLPYKFDLSIYHHIQNAALLEHINRVGEVFYKKN